MTADCGTTIDCLRRLLPVSISTSAKRWDLDPPVAIGQTHPHHRRARRHIQFGMDRAGPAPSNPSPGNALKADPCRSALPRCGRSRAPGRWPSPRFPRGRPVLNSISPDWKPHAAHGRLFDDGAVGEGLQREGANGVGPSCAGSSMASSGKPNSMRLRSARSTSALRLPPDDFDGDEIVCLLLQNFRALDPDFRQRLACRNLVSRNRNIEFIDETVESRGDAETRNSSGSTMPETLWILP